MRRLLMTIWLVMICASLIIAQKQVQAKLRHLKLGKTNINEIQELFGEADSKKKLTSWVTGVSTEQEVDFYIANSQLTKNYGNAPIRNLLAYQFRHAGLTFYVFDNPSELHSIEITNRRLWSHGIRVGDSLATVEKLLGTHGDWWSSDSTDNWNLEFAKLGVRFSFSRAPKLPKYPMRLTRRATVISIEIFDKRVHFL